MRNPQPPPKYMVDILKKYGFELHNGTVCYYFNLRNPDYTNSKNDLCVYVKRLGYTPYVPNVEISLIQCSGDVWKMILERIEKPNTQLFAGKIFNQEFLITLLKSILGDPYQGGYS